MRLIDADKLLEELKADENAKGKIPSLYETIKTFARAKIEKAPTADKWIKCDDEKPPIDTTVIVCYFGSDVIIPDYKNGETLEQCMKRLNKTPTVTIGFLADEGWCGGDGWPMMIAPTYWKPMPEAPEMG